MTQPHNIIIHEFSGTTLPRYTDNEGDEMEGFYFQFTDVDDRPLSDLIGPYRYEAGAKKAAMRAFKAKDY